MKFKPRHRLLLYGIASSILISALGGAYFHIRNLSGASSTELIAWMIFVASTVYLLTHVTLQTYDEESLTTESYLGIGASSAIISIVPFALIKSAMYTWGIGQLKAYSLLFGIVIVLTFLMTVGIFITIQRSVEKCDARHEEDEDEDKIESDGEETSLEEYEEIDDED